MVGYFLFSWWFLFITGLLVSCLCGLFCCLCGGLDLVGGFLGLV